MALDAASVPRPIRSDISMCSAEPLTRAGIALAPSVVSDVPTKTTNQTFVFTLDGNRQLAFRIDKSNRERLTHVNAGWFAARSPQIPTWRKRFAGPCGFSSAPF